MSKGRRLRRARAEAAARGIATPADTVLPGLGRGAVHLISDEYVPEFLASLREQETLDQWAAALLRSCSRDDFLRAGIAATYVAGVMGERGRRLRHEWQTHMIGTLQPRLRRPLERALGATGPPRTLMDRATLLRALRLAVLRAPEHVDLRTRKDPGVVLTLLSHYASRGARQSREGEPRLGGYPETLAMEVIQNAYFHSVEEFGDALARYRLLWTAYESDLVRYRPRAELARMLREATELDLDDILALGFACYADASRARQGVSPEVDLSVFGIPADTVDRFLGVFSRTADDLEGEFRRHGGQWEFLPFESTPLLRTGPTTVAVLDVGLLQTRLTLGLYWLVHDYEKQHSELRREQWSQTYSELVEIHAERQLVRLARSADAGVVIFTEDDMAALPGSNPDIGFQSGHTVVLCDVVQHQITTPARHRGDAAKFREDVRVTVLEKARQLDSGAQELMATPMPLGSPAVRPVHRIVPVVVCGAPFPVNPITLQHIREQLTEQALLTDVRCGPLLVVNLSEIEMLECLVEAGHATVRGVLAAWSSTGPAASLRDYIYETFPGEGLTRPASVSAVLDQQFQLIQSKLMTDDR